MFPIFKGFIRQVNNVHHFIYLATDKNLTFDITVAKDLP